MRAVLAVLAFLVGFALVYAIAMGLAFFGYSSFAGLPYEQLLAWMCAGGVLCAIVPLVRRRA